MKTAIEKACDLVGGQTALARRIEQETGESLTNRAVHKWIKLGRVPAERALLVEKVSGVPRHELRPDLYPKEAA